MSSLTEFRYNIRLTIKIVGICLIVFLAYKVIAKIFRGTPPPPIPAAPTVLYGKLPSPVFKSVTSTLSPSAIYSLDLYAPTLPVVPDRLNVYPLIPTTTSLFGPERARKIAANYGFSGEPEINNDTMYIWRDTDFSRILEINLFTREYTLTYDWKGNPDLLNSSKFSSQNQAESLGIAAIQKSGLYPPELTNGTRKVSFLKVVGNELRGTEKVTEATIARIDFFRADVNKLPAFSENNITGNVTVLIANTTETKRNILSLEYHFNIFNYTAKIATYPIKTSQQAWADVTTGKGTPVYFSVDGIDPNISITPPAIKEIRAKRVSLGYYDTRSTQNYMQPIYLFDCEARLEGDKTGVYYLYVPALTDAWLLPASTATEPTE